MELALSADDDRRFVEGTPGEEFMRGVEDAAAVLEACMSHRVDRVLLYSENLTAGFFDLSSGEAGAILQKLRNYGVRVAIVRSPAVRLSRRFGEMVVEEERGPYFRLFEDRDAAREWLCGD